AKLRDELPAGSRTRVVTRLGGRPVCGVLLHWGNSGGCRPKLSVAPWRVDGLCADGGRGGCVVDRHRAPWLAAACCPPGCCLEGATCRAGRSGTGCPRCPDCAPAPASPGCTAACPR